MEHLLLEVPGWIITGVIGLIGIGIGWGFFKSEVSNLRKEQDLQRIKVESLEAKKMDVAFKVDCGAFRENCQGQMDERFVEIKEAINKNRETVVSQFQEIREFIGYVKRFVEQINGRNH
jgi:hypothetical protein